MASGAKVFVPAAPVKVSPFAVGPAGAPLPAVVGPNFSIGQSIAYGKFIPVFAGHVRIPCEHLWLKDALTFSTGDNPLPFATFMEIAGQPLTPDTARTLLQVHANGNLIIDTATGFNHHAIQYTFYPGSTTQPQDPDHVADKGAAYTPAYRQRACIKVLDFPTEPYGGQLPVFTLTMKDTAGASRLSVEELFKRYADFKNFPRANLICEGLDGLEVHGMSTFEQDLSLKDFLALHCPLFGADYFERGATIVVTRKVVGSTYLVTKTIDEEDLIPLDEDGAVHTDLPDDLELPDHFELTYYALEVGFQRVPVYFRTRVTNTPKWYRVACCLVITPQEAQTYITTLALRFYQSAIRHRIRLGPKHIDSEPADIVAFVNRGFEYLCKTHAAIIAADGMDLELLNILVDESVTAAGGFAGDPPPELWPSDGTLSGTERADTVAATGSAVSISTGTLAATEGADTLAAVGVTVASFVLLEDGTSKVLLEDGTSHLLLQG